MGGGGQDSILGSERWGKAKDFDREGRDGKAAKYAKKI
jgi:hypothetical protein